MSHLKTPGLFTTQQKMVMRLMEHWQLTDAQRASVLALGNTEQEQQAVFEQLLAIHKMLRQLFPANRQLAYRWVTSQNAAFDGATPIELIQRKRERGVQDAHDYLVHFVAGSVSGQQPSAIDLDTP